MANKYRIELGSLVTKVMNRTYVISAENDIEAIEKAKRRFISACENSPKYIDCDGEIVVEAIHVQYR